MTESYDRFRIIRKKMADISNSIAVLQWDMEVNMPPKGANFRAQQLSTLTGILHELSVSQEYEGLLEHLNSTRDSFPFKERKNIEEAYRIYSKDKKLSKDFVERFSRQISDSYQAWLKAREENDFKIFAPYLARIVEMSREKAELYGYEAHPYDALLDEYEPGLTVAQLEGIFPRVKTELSAFLELIRTKPQPDASVLAGDFDTMKQMALCRELVTKLGYDFNAGRLDLSPHPFSTGFSAEDVRITTRLSKTNLAESVWGVIHEAGHAMYEQGLPATDYGLPSGEYISLAIHESQSRLWENNVGKSWSYISSNWPLFQQYFPESFAGKPAEDFFKALNIVEPNLIRTDSDEVTYHFHVLLRYEIEKGLIEGKLNPIDLEEIWNENIKTFLGLDVPDAKRGVLQDIHWSHGSLGYFPTYSLGSFYAAQFYAHAAGAIPDLKGEIEKQNFQPLLTWLRTHIHGYGRQYSADELCRKITGESLNFKYFMDYLHAKYARVYDL